MAESTNKSNYFLMQRKQMGVIGYSLIDNMLSLIENIT